MAGPRQKPSDAGARQPRLQTWRRSNSSQASSNVLIPFSRPMTTSYCPYWYGVRRQEAKLREA